jgi:hypothetical protein
MPNLLLLLLNPSFRSLGPVFADGNVNFKDFKSQHDCNVYCQHFGIAGNFSEDKEVVNVGEGNDEAQVVDMQFSQVGGM